MMLNRRNFNQTYTKLFEDAGLRMVLSRRILNERYLELIPDRSLRMMLNRRNCFRLQKTKETTLL